MTLAMSPRQRRPASTPSRRRLASAGVSYSAGIVLPQGRGYQGIHRCRSLLGGRV